MDLVHGDSGICVWVLSLGPVPPHDEQFRVEGSINTSDHLAIW
jgi:hypothetical protein